MVYNHIPTGTLNPPADEVLGQSDFTTGSSAVSAQDNNLKNPGGVQAVDGLVYVSDSYQQRVLAFMCGAPTPTPTPTPTPALGCCSNGGDWMKVSTTGNFTPGTGLASTVYDPGTGPRIWIVDNQGRVVNSPNGSDWTTVGTVPFGVRFFATLTVFDPGDGQGPRMWYIGGFNGNMYNDVWYSFNGVSWTQATPNAPFSARYGHTCLAFGGKLWVIGGFDGGNLNDVWSSPDGVNWTQVMANAAFTPRSFHNSVVFNNRMWVIDGGTNDVWSSADGADWTQATANAAFPAREQAGSYVFCGNIWVVGGVYSFQNTNTVYNDLWYSPDGANWTQAAAIESFAPRLAFGALVFHNHPWVFGGGGNGGDKNDIWEANCPPTPIPTPTPGPCACGQYSFALVGPGASDADFLSGPEG
ncbi:MAG TPA: hypothetical protein VJ873_04750, partial [bacterium]|nr:hypothetical protein [bacterium]